MVDRPSTDRPDVGLPTTAPGSRLRRLTIRARLTLTYAGLVTGSGAVLIALVYLYMRQLQVAVPEQAPSTDGVEEEVYLRITLMSEFLNTMLVISLGALVLLALLSGAVGWVVAGRMLAPLSTMNDAAKPLATAQTMIDVTLADPAASAEQLRSLAERLRETNRANVETVDALLDLAEAQSGDLYREQVDLGEVVASALSQLVPEAGAREVDLPEPPDALVVVEGDPVLLRQAVSNLLRNAVRHNVAHGGIELELTSTDDRARLRVSNDGPLVPAERLESLREPFVRGSGRGRTRDAGHGLGLAIVSAVATAHNGVLELSANPSGGLTATLDLPVRNDDPTHPEDDPAA